MTIADTVGRLIGRGAGPTETGVAAGLATLLADPTFELLPLKSVSTQIDALPPGARVSVTASPAKGLDATLQLAADLQRRGFRAVPHLSARMVHDRAHLADVLARMATSGLTNAFIVGGDGMHVGAYADGLHLLKAIHEVGPVPDAIGIPCYPDGHVFVAEAALLEALRAKLPYATWMTTQLCFDAAKIRGWLLARRSEGIATPAVIGVPGVTEPHRLLQIGARIGVRDMRRFVRKNVGLVTRLARSGGFYRPDDLLRAMAPLALDPTANVAGIHLYTFNQVAATEAWREATLAELHGTTAG